MMNDEGSDTPERALYVVTGTLDIPCSLLYTPRTTGKVARIIPPSCLLIFLMDPCWYGGATMVWTDLASSRLN